MSKKIEIDKEKILPIYERVGRSVDATAKELGINWSTCKRILQEYGVVTDSNRNQFGVYPIYNLFQKIENQYDAYWLGMLYADGWIRSDVNQIGLGSTDRELIEWFKDYTQSPNSIQTRKKDYMVGKLAPDGSGRVFQSSKPLYTLEFSCKLTKQNLIKLGCMPKKSKILQCPTQEQVPDLFLWHFIRGYIDGDGWLRWDDESHRYSFGLMGTQHFLEGILTRLQILHYGKIRKKEDSDICTFSIEKKALVEKMLHNLYDSADIYLSRKHQNYLNLIGRSSI